MNPEQVHITESPRDAQQGLPYTIPAEYRAAYINELMQAGFDVIDFGSFVSPKAVPQMADSDKVLDLIDKSGSATKLLAIVGNTRGASDAATREKTDIIGFPYSVSNTFLQKNINSDIGKVWRTAQEIGKICSDKKKKIRVFVSMAFGNPYGDRWNENIVSDCVKNLVDSGVQTITLSDTIGLATATSIRSIFEQLLPLYPQTEIGLHLHTEQKNWREKTDAAWKAGCRSYDGVINGIGGFPITRLWVVGDPKKHKLFSFFFSEK
ncbi:MAG TPA: hydroxymethylglutaryl-CoA lyase, partial [Niabella sp.]|nr:hydroxymethylglutaryl-CoA lyase [Niabella sp.]